MKTAERFVLDDGKTVWIEVEEPKAHGYEPVSRRKAEEERQFKKALDRIKPAADDLLATLRGLTTGPDEIEVEFGIKISGELGALIASTSTEANFKIMLRWTGGK